MVHSTYRFALLTFNLLCSIEAMKESFVGGDSMVDAYGAEDKGQKLQVSLGEHDTGHGETENEANGEDVAFVEVTASGALTTIARPRNSSLVEAFQADEAESAGEAEQDEDTEESDEVDGATSTGEAEKTKEAENDQPPHRLAAEADRVHAATAAKSCFECISKDFVFCKDSGVEKCFVSDSVADNNKCVVKVKKDGVNLQLPALPAVNKNFAFSASVDSTYLKEAQGVQSQSETRSQSVAKLATLRFGDCGVLMGKKLVDCSTPADKCAKKDCERFCSAKNGGKTTYCNNGGGSWVCGGGAIAIGKEKDTCASCIHTKNLLWCPTPGHEFCATSMPANCKRAHWSKAKYDSFNGNAKKKGQIPASCKPESLTKDDGEYSLPSLFD